MARPLAAAMAERILLSIPAREKCSHRVSCQPPDDDDEASEEVPASGGRLGKLEWRIVVHEERFVDLEVKYLLRGPVTAEGNLASEVLQKRASGQNFWGSFIPSEHRKMKKESLDRLEAVVFEFDNSYSWFTPKEVELILVREADAVSRPPMPLPSVPRPGSPAPRHPGSEVDGLGANLNLGPETQFMQIFTPPPSPRHTSSGVEHVLAPDLRAASRQDAEGREGDESTTSVDNLAASTKQSYQLLAQLDAWLAAAERLAPGQHEGVEVLADRIATVRRFCAQKMPEVLAV